MTMPVVTAVLKYEERPCPACKTIFVPTHHRQQYCMVGCLRQQRLSQIKKLQVYKSFRRPRANKMRTTCLRCDKLFWSDDVKTNRRCVSCKKATAHIDERMALGFAWAMGQDEMDYFLCESDTVTV